MNCTNLITDDILSDSAEFNNIINNIDEAHIIHMDEHNYVEKQVDNALEELWGDNELHNTEDIISNNKYRIKSHIISEFSMLFKDMQIRKLPSLKENILNEINKYEFRQNIEFYEDYTLLCDKFPLLFQKL